MSSSPLALPHGDLEGHGAVVRRADPHGRAELGGILEGEIQDAEEAGALPLDGEPLLLDLDAPDEKLPVDRLDEIAVGNGFQVAVPTGGGMVRSSARVTTWLWECDSVAIMNAVLL